MAKRHILLRYAQAENEYLEMKGLVAELDAALKDPENPIDRETYEEKAELIEEEVEQCKLKYFFWAEVLSELNKPNRKNNKMDSTTEAWYNYLQTETRKCLKDTGQDPFKVLKEVLKEGRKNDVQ